LHCQYRGEFVSNWDYAGIINTPLISRVSYAALPYFHKAADVKKKQEKNIAALRNRL